MSKFILFAIPVAPLSGINIFSIIYSLDQNWYKQQCCTWRNFLPPLYEL